MAASVEYVGVELNAGACERFCDTFRRVRILASVYNCNGKIYRAKYIVPAAVVAQAYSFRPQRRVCCGVERHVIYEWNGLHVIAYIGQAFNLAQCRLL